MLTLIISVLIGGVIGAAMGWVGKCSSGTCPLTSTWWRGGLYGAVMGLVFFLVSGQGGGLDMNRTTKNVKPVSESQFTTEVLQASQPVLVDFYAVWCGPCKALAPIVEEVAGQYAGKIQTVKVNVDEASALAQRYNIESIPTLMVFKDGKPVATRVGGASKETLASWLQKTLEAKANPADAPRPTEK